jgi:hypothetical protein
VGEWNEFSFAMAPITTLGDLIARWKPVDCGSEKQYEESLYQFLHAEFPTTRIVRQYHRGTQHIDLLIGKEVGVELKYNLHKQTEFHRLKGQLDDYLEWEISVLIVLAGATEPDMKKRLDEWVKKHNDLFDTRFTVLTVDGK